MQAQGLQPYLNRHRPCLIDIVGKTGNHHVITQIILSVIHAKNEKDGALGEKIMGTGPSLVGYGGEAWDKKRLPEKVSFELSSSG